MKTSLLQKVSINRNLPNSLAQRHNIAYTRYIPTDQPIVNCKTAYYTSWDCQEKIQRGTNIAFAINRIMVAYQPHQRRIWEEQWILRGISWFSSVPPAECKDSTLKLGHDRFVPNPFQLIVIHLSPCHWRYKVLLLEKRRKINYQPVNKPTLDITAVLGNPELRSSEQHHVQKTGKY
jgi:hypothetical protein